MLLIAPDSSAQTSFWGEGAYDLEKAEFRLDVKAFFSHGKDLAGFNLLTNKYDEKTHYYQREQRDCITDEGNTVTLFDYNSPSIKDNEARAYLRDINFPSLGMIADTNYKMVAVAARVDLNSSAEIEALLRTLAGIYGADCLFREGSWGNQFVWLLADRRIQACITPPKENDEQLILYYEVDADGKKKITQLESEPNMRYKCHVMIVENSHCKFMESLPCRNGAWAYFEALKHDFTNSKPHDFKDVRIDLK